ncbi:MAG: acyl-CoA dehydrogenase family protein [Myxococcota bacterium]|nr:acyl-CoA dehydrogenase family protein [Myxococcota bacterium]
MFVDLTREQKAVRDEIRAYFDKLMTDELREEMKGTEGGGPLFRETLRKLGEDRWLGIGWPEEYGGQDRSAIEQYLFAEEVQRVGFPLPFLTLGTVGPTLMQFGTDEQRKRFLPRILRGEILFAIGYSEPEAGTDLASLKTRAVRDGDEYVINGQKVFTSLADHSDYVWLAARTDPDAPKHRGISMFIVPLDAPGVKVTPIYTMGGIRTNATYYEDVRVPAENLVGGENRGWTLITNQLNHERVSLFNYGPMGQIYDDVVAWARETEHPEGGKVIDRPWVQANLARFRAHLEVLKVMNWKQAWEITQGGLHPAEASAVKVFASEFNISGYHWLLEVLGEAGTIRDGSPGAILRGRVERTYRSMLILTFGGGTNEVQRDIIAMAGLGMPHYKS